MIQNTTRAAQGLGRAPRLVLLQHGSVFAVTAGPRRVGATRSRASYVKASCSLSGAYMCVRKSHSLLGSSCIARKTAPISSRSSRSRAVTCNAVFERFSERAIKAVMISQAQAKELGAQEVRWPVRQGRCNRSRCAGANRFGLAPSRDSARATRQYVPRACSQAVGAETAVPLSYMWRTLFWFLFLARGADCPAQRCSFAMSHTHTHARARPPPRDHLHLFAWSTKPLPLFPFPP
jgi:hypothetical protein